MPSGGGERKPKVINRKEVHVTRGLSLLRCEQVAQVPLSLSQVNENQAAAHLDPLLPLFYSWLSRARSSHCDGAPCLLPLSPLRWLGLPDPWAPAKASPHCTAEAGLAFPEGWGLPKTQDESRPEAMLRELDPPCFLDLKSWFFSLVPHVGPQVPTFFLSPNLQSCFPG